MDIIIPTYGRATKQETAKWLDYAGIDYTLVVQRREVDKYVGTAKNIHVLPDEIKTIAPTRQWILHNVGTDPHLVMLDDDLVFYKRRDDDPTKLREVHDFDIRNMFTTMDINLAHTPHVGIAAREGANRNTEPFINNTRIMRVLGYNRDVLKKENIRFDEMEVMEDFHVALTLLERGYPNVLLNLFANNQGGSGSAGGCSSFRTRDLHNRAAERLAELHPNFVTVVEKTTKGSFGGGTRKDVRIQWKEAYKYGQARTGLGVLDY